MLPQNEVSHLVCECARIAKLPFCGENEEYIYCGVSRVDINKEASALVGRAAGRYVSVTFGELSALCDEAIDEIIQKTAREISDLIGRTASGCKNILVVGIGERRVTHDSLGARVCEDLGACEDLFVFEAGTAWRSGIDTAALVKSVALSCEAGLVIAVDSLAAQSEDRVGRVIQISDSGIAPGSGAGKTGEAICRSTVGVPVISIGVPTALVVKELKESGFLAVGNDILALCERSAHVISSSIAKLHFLTE